MVRSARGYSLPRLMVGGGCGGPDKDPDSKPFRGAGGASPETPSFGELERSVALVGQGGSLSLFICEIVAQGVALGLARFAILHEVEERLEILSRQEGAGLGWGLRRRKACGSAHGTWSSALIPRWITRQQLDGNGKRKILGQLPDDLFGRAHARLPLSELAECVVQLGITLLLARAGFLNLFLRGGNLLLQLHALLLPGAVLDDHKRGERDEH